jgi:hypothetical protein
MGPERKDKLQSTDPVERLQQEHEAVLAESARLVAEMEVLMQRAKDLEAKHLALMQKTRKSLK